MTMTRLQRIQHALAYVVVLAACGGDDDATTGAEGPTTTVSTSVGTSSGSTSESETSSASTTVSTSSTSSATTESGTVDDTTTSSSDTSSTAASSESSSGTTGELATCTPDSVCPDGTSCRLSMCCEGVGFCTAPDVPKCGGFIGTPCRGGTVCVLDSCVADGDGVCLDPEDAAAVDAEQPDCWNVG